MTSTPSPATFDKKRASNYDERIRWGIPGYEALHALALDVLADALPEQARLLVAGAGTGMEVLTLGAARPGWRFTAADPAVPMLEVLRARVGESGLSPRVAVRNAFVRDLPPEDKDFDGATSLLVSHFINDQDERIAYFRSIADRLKPGAPLVFADVHGDKSDPVYQRLYTVWKARCLRSGMDRPELEALFARMDTDVAILPEARLMELVRAGGFDSPAPFWRGLIFGAWAAGKR